MADVPAASLAAVDRALAAARTASYESAWAMPGAFYTDPAVLGAELEHLFRRQWLCVGRVEEVARPGDFMAFDIVDEPVVVMRGADGRLRALSNVCRHRAMPLAAGKGNAGNGLLCPYHHWSYDTTGRLLSTPRLGSRADFPTANCRLPAFALEEWLGFIFVCLDAGAPPLAPVLAGLEERLRPYHFEQTQLRYVADEVWACNWKHLVENFMEGYHLSTLHRETLHKVNPTRLCRHFPPGDAFFGYYAGFDPSLPRGQKGHPDLRPEQYDDCVMFAVPPGLVVGGAADYSSFLCVQPAGTDRVRVKLGLIFYGDDWPSATVDWAVQLFQDTMAEDKTVLNELQRGVRSRHYLPGPLAGPDHEGPVLDFFRYLARHLPALATAP